MTHEEPPRPNSSPNEGEPTDGSLLRRLRGGSEEAAAQIYQRYAHRLRALAQARCAPDLASRFDVEDIVQSVFGSFFRAASRGYYAVPDDEELWKLFLVIALNKIRAKGAYHRAAKRDVRVTTDESGLDHTLEGIAATDETAQAFLQLAIDEALDRLPGPHKQMVLFRIEGYEVAEISQQTGRSKRTVERILQEARKRLSEFLDAEK